MKAADGEALVLLILCLAVAILLSHVVHVKRWEHLGQRPAVERLCRLLKREPRVMEPSSFGHARCVGLS
jgi:hypothetical protein